MKIIFILGIVCYVAFASQYVPIPKKENGILIGSPYADVNIDLIYDPACDDTAAFDPIFQEAWDLLDNLTQEKVSVRFLSFSLPYHTAAQKLTQAIIYVQKQLGNEQAVTLFRDFLQNVDSNTDTSIRNETITGLMTRIAQRVNALFGLKVQDILKQLAHHSNTNTIVRQWSKYVMGSIKVAGTPKFRINGVVVDQATSMSAQQLANLIKSLFVTVEEASVN